MTMVSTGPISLGGNATSGGLNQSVNIELGRSATASINMNESAVRTLAGVPSGAISMSNFYGKANQFAFTISSNQTNADLRTLAVNAGWNQNSKVVATIGSGVIISSNGTGTPALTVSGSFPNGVDLINTGVIVGMGGAGGRGASSVLWPNANGQPGEAGGLALSVSAAVSINNASGTIAGGGGGGGGGGNFDDKAGGTAGGGGGGGGRSSAAANSAGGAGGPGFNNWPGGNPGGAGTYSGPGGGGAGGTQPGRVAGTGGTGGGWGSAGAGGGSANVPWYPPGAGGAGGGAVSGNGNVTWLAFGTRLGAIS